MDKRSVQLLLLKENHDARFDNLIGTSDVLVKLDAIWAVLDSLGSPKTDEEKNATLMFGSKNDSSHIFLQVSARSDKDLEQTQTVYHCLKHLPYNWHWRE